MAEKSTIEWTDATWNPITGCTMVDAGCTNCYAMGLAGTRLKNHPSRSGLTRQSGDRHVWTGELRLNQQWMDQPLRWRRPRMIFVCAHGDLFHEAVPDKWIDQVFAVMALAGQHTFQVLTKRPERAARYLAEPGDAILSRMASALPPGSMPICQAEIIGRIHPAYNGPWGKPKLPWPLPNVWLGTSISDQASADLRIPQLLQAPAAVRFVSAEPLLGPVDLTRWLKGCHECAEECGFRSGEAEPPRAERCHACGWVGEDAGEFCPSCGAQDFGGVCPDCNANVVQHHPDTPCLDWVIVGGESGPGARPMHPDWARALRDQCQAAGVAFFFKQWGDWAPGVFVHDQASEFYDGPVLYCDAAASTGERSPYPGMVWNPDTGKPTEFWTDLSPEYFDGRDIPACRRVGKALAGRLLDGRTWDQMPEQPHA